MASRSNEGIALRFLLTPELCGLIDELTALFNALTGSNPLVSGRQQPAAEIATYASYGQRKLPVKPGSTRHRQSADERIRWKTVPATVRSTDGHSRTGDIRP